MLIYKQQGYGVVGLRSPCTGEQLAHQHTHATARGWRREWEQSTRAQHLHKSELWNLLLWTGLFHCHCLSMYTSLVPLQGTLVHLLQCPLGHGWDQPQLLGMAEISHYYLLYNLVQGDGLLPYLYSSKSWPQCQPLLRRIREGEQQITTYRVVAIISCPSISSLHIVLFNLR